MVEETSHSLFYRSLIVARCCVSIATRKDKV